MTSLLFFVSVCRTWFREQSCSLTGIRQLDRVQQPLTVTLNYFAWNTEMWPNSATSNSTYFFFDINFWLLPEQIVTNHPPIGITGLAATFHWLQNPVELIWLVLAHWNTPICHWVRQQFFFAAVARSGVVIYVVAEPNYSQGPQWNMVLVIECNGGGKAIGQFPPTSGVCFCPLGGKSCCNPLHFAFVFSHCSAAKEFFNLYRVAFVHFLNSFQGRGLIMTSLSGD